jgi:GLPGLI family protein
MKKIQVFFAGILLLFITVPAIAQQGEPALVTITYAFVHVNDTNHRESPIRENMALCVGQNSSKYTNAINEDRIRKSVKAIRNLPPVPPPVAADGSVKVVRGHPMAIVYGRGYTQDCLFQHIKEKKLNIESNLGSTLYLTEASLPKINWKLDKETRKIGEYTCQKAVGDYVGRTYTAWFTTELPFRNGPWKLNGLPGLILEASDAKNEVAFLYKDISRDTTYRDTDMYNKDQLIKVNAKAYERAYEAYLNDPQGVVLSQHSDESSITLAYVDSTGKITVGDKAKALVEQFKKETVSNTNNPLELIKQ